MRDYSANLTILPGPYRFESDALSLRVNGGSAIDVDLGPDTTTPRELLAALNVLSELALVDNSVYTLRRGMSMSLEVVNITPNASEQLGWVAGQCAYGWGDYADYSRPTSLELETARLTRSSPSSTPKK